MSINSLPEAPPELRTLPRVQKPRSIRELCPLDVTEIQSLVESLPESLWNVENARKENNFPCFHHTRHIVFRFIEGNRDPRVFYSHPIWQIWKNKLEPMFAEIASLYGISNPVYPKAMLARLAGGHSIDRHIDGAGSNLHTHKIHVPLQTNPGAIFESNGCEHHLKEGIAYEANNIAPHAVRNDGDEDRIHLIFELFDGDA